MSLFSSSRSHRAPATSIDRRYRHRAVPSGDPLAQDLRTAVEIYQASRPMTHLLIR